MRTKQAFCTFHANALFNFCVYTHVLCTTMLEGKTCFCHNQRWRRYSHITPIYKPLKAIYIFNNNKIIILCNRDRANDRTQEKQSEWMCAVLVHCSGDQVFSEMKSHSIRCNMMRHSYSCLCGRMLFICKYANVVSLVLCITYYPSNVVRFNLFFARSALVKYLESTGTKEQLSITALNSLNFVRWHRYAPR